MLNTDVCGCYIGWFPPNPCFVVASLTKKINLKKIETGSRQEPVSPLPDPVLSQNLSAVFPVHRFRFPGRLFVVVVVVVVPLEAAADVIKLFKG
jgi:hypothetical protein